MKVDDGEEKQQDKERTRQWVTRWRGRPQNRK